MTSYLPVQAPLVEGTDGLKYGEILPAPCLRRFIASYWFMDNGPGRSAVVRVVPDGCVDVIVRLAGREVRVWVDGFMGGPALVEVPGAVRFVGARLRPGAARLLLACPASAYAGRDVELADVCGEAAELAAGMERAAGPADRISLLERFLMGRFTAPRGDPGLIAYVLDAIYAARGDISMRWLAGSVYVSPRHLRRLFNDWIGTNPKTFCRIVRFQNILSDLLSPGKANTLDLALSYGYYDYAHFVHDFR